MVTSFLLHVLHVVSRIAQQEADESGGRGLRINILRFAEIASGGDEEVNVFLDNEERRRREERYEDWRSDRTRLSFLLWSYLNVGCFLEFIAPMWLGFSRDLIREGMDISLK